MSTAGVMVMHGAENEDVLEQESQKSLMTRRFETLERFICCHCCKEGCTPQVRTLGLTFVLFGSITFVQLVAALYANSLALLGDCASMFIDTCTYLANILAECGDNEKKKQKRQLIASGMSLIVLLGITGYVIYSAAVRLILEETTGINVKVNAHIVLVFAVAGLIFDFISFCGFVYWSSDATNEINMWSALLHVGADTMRSTTTLIESILIIHYDTDPEITDAWASIVVSGLIVVASFGGIYAWVLEARNFLEKKFFLPVLFADCESDDDEPSLDSIDDAKEKRINRGIHELLHTHSEQTMEMTPIEI